MEINKIEINKIENIKISGMILKVKTDEESKDVYEIKSSVNIQLTNEIKKELESNNISNLLELMYNDLIEKSSKYDIDAIGIWIKYNGQDYENSMKLQTLNDMKEHGVDDVIPIFEFFELTLGNYDI